MGAYLNKPVTEKETECGESKWIRYAATSMQGWRINQEDAHNCIIDFDGICSLFAVYDGHGGSEVAQYTSMHFPDFLKSNADWSIGQYATAIEKSFLEFDDLLRSESVLKELKKMATPSAPKRKESSEDEEDKALLYEEAAMPLESILQRYGFFLRKERNGLSPLLDFNELFVRQDGESVESVKEEGIENESKFNEEKNTVTKDKQNAASWTKDASSNEEKENNKVADFAKKVERIEGKKECEDAMDEKSSTDEKSKKRLNDSSPISAKAKRTKSEDTNGTTIETCDSFSASCSNFDAQDETKENNAGSLESRDEAAAKLTEGGCSSVEGEVCPSPGDGSQAASGDPDSEQDEDYNNDESEEEESEADEVDADYNSPSGDIPGEDSGATACLALVFKHSIIVGNVGDSRAVLCRGGVAIELSHDHKPEDEIERKRIEAAGGEISMDGRVNGGLNLSRALGDHFYKKNLDLPLKDQMISALPDVKEIKLQPEDEFLIIACDGIWNSLSSQQVVDFVRQRLRKGSEEKEICEKLCEQCLSPNTAGDGTGCDNMTVIIVKILHGTNDNAE